MPKPFLTLLYLGLAAVLLTGQDRFDYLAKRAYDSAAESSQGGRAKQAVKSYEEIIKKYPHSVWAEHSKVKIAEYYMTQRDYRNAKKELATVKPKSSFNTMNAYDTTRSLDSLERRREIYDKNVTRYYSESLTKAKTASAKDEAELFSVHLLRPGMTRDEVKKTAGAPESVQQYSNDKVATEIWYYGEWQVVFGREKFVSHVNRKNSRKEAHIGSK